MNGAEWRLSETWSSADGAETRARSTGRASGTSCSGWAGGFRLSISRPSRFQKQNPVSCTTRRGPFNLPQCISFVSMNRDPAVRRPVRRKNRRIILIPAPNRRCIFSMTDRNSRIIGAKLADAESRTERALLTGRRLRRGVHDSIEYLKTSILDFIELHNEREARHRPPKKVSNESYKPSTARFCATEVPDSISKSHLAGAMQIESTAAPKQGDELAL